MASLAISRRLFLRNTAAVGAVATTIAAPVVAEASAVSAEDRFFAARAEFIAALKAMHPDIQDWRSVEEEPHERNVVFMVVGRKLRVA